VGSVEPLLTIADSAFIDARFVASIYIERFPELRVAPDGRFLMLKERSSPSSVESQIILVQNWVEELRRAVPTN
jgi:hypothetical protein